MTDATGLYVALPTEAIFFGLFLISKLLEKETALDDREQRAARAAAIAANGGGPPPSNAGKAGPGRKSPA